LRTNANGRLLDVWMLVLCTGCGRTSKVPIHERAHVRDLDGARPRADGKASADFGFAVRSGLRPSFGTPSR